MSVYLNDAMTQVMICADFSWIQSPLFSCVTPIPFTTILELPHDHRRRRSEVHSPEKFMRNITVTTIRVMWQPPQETL